MRSSTLLDPIRKRYEALRADERELRRLLGRRRKARAASAPTLETMYERMASRSRVVALPRRGGNECDGS